MADDRLRVVMRALPAASRSDELVRAVEKEVAEWRSDAVLSLARSAIRTCMHCYTYMHAHTRGRMVN